MQLGIPDKLSFVLFVWTCAFLLPWQFNILCIVLVVLLAFTFKPFKAVTKAGRKYFWRFGIYSILFMFVLIAANGLLLREGAIQLKLLMLEFHESGLVYGLKVSVRLILLSLSILVFFGSIHFQDFANYLQFVGLPRTLVSILLMTIFFLEQLPRRIGQIFTAQEARGAPVRAGFTSRTRAFFLVLSPLVLSSIAESVERGVALELRGYNLRRTSNNPERIGEPPNRSGYLFLFLSALVIILSVYRWLFN